jgi:multidrug resistance efflux pump
MSEKENIHLSQLEKEHTHLQEEAIQFQAAYEAISAQYQQAIQTADLHEAQLLSDMKDLNTAEIKLAEDECL